ncbi:hypothetical protein JD844_001572, partial [Phrynosoma platyrhinos]
MMEEPVAYQVGPMLVCLNDSCTKTVLPGHGYSLILFSPHLDSVRYVLCDQAQTRLAATNWSQPFRTR